MNNSLVRHPYWVVLLCMAWACQAPQPASEMEKEPVVSSDIQIPDDALHFFVIGDWGRNGQMGQQAVADQMGKLAQVIEPEFIISTGDNFYPNGVASVDDPYWISSYEAVYKDFSLFMPWYVVLGNHDYRGNAQAQIDYTQKSRRWNMPSRYYNFMVDNDGIKASFIFVDSNPYELKYYDEAKYQSVVSQDTVAQNRWLDSVLTASQAADWIVVIGHHPCYSGGKRIDATKDIRNHYTPIFAQYGVDAYFAGHEHDLQVIKPEGRTWHFVSGAGSEIRPTGNIEGLTRFAASQHGFMAVSLRPDTLLVQLVNEKGDLLYQEKIGKPIRK